MTDECEAVGGMKSDTENPPLYYTVHHKSHMIRLMWYLNTECFFFVGKYVNTIDERIRHTRFLKKADEIISRKSLMKRNLHNDALFFNRWNSFNQD